ncbi:unnamed protein product [Diatraea saccharalis]|uniref:Uncharacterized protein n=1 Tax=Diatraea saccharalis TaxID=40085 RepID=A0A9N9WF68_9NEOP|nr:unnamed protein product [Diatraea saccharalis]
MENVTFRVHRRKRASSLGSTGELTKLISPSNSLPDIDMNTSITMLTEKITCLETELASAKDELENLSMENRDLKMHLEKCNKKIEQYETIQSSEGFLSPIPGKKRKKPIIEIDFQETQKKKSIDSPKLLQNCKLHLDRIAELQERNKQLVTWLEDQKNKKQVVPTNKKKLKIIKWILNNKKVTRIRKSTIRKIKKIVKRNTVLEKKCCALKNIHNKLEFKINELQENITIHRNRTTKINEIDIPEADCTGVRNHSPRKNKIHILSDEIGKDLAVNITDKLTLPYRLINYLVQQGPTCELTVENNKIKPAFPDFPVPHRNARGETRLIRCIQKLPELYIYH